MAAPSGPVDVWEQWPIPPVNDAWPVPPAGDVDATKKVFEAKIAAVLKRIEATNARGQAEDAAAYLRKQAEEDAALNQDKEFHKALLDVAKAGVDRARSNAEIVQKAAGAIGVLYTGILGVTFSVTSRPLPIRGVIPVFFLGLTVFLSSAYVSRLSRAREYVKEQLDPPFTIDGQTGRIGIFIKWIRLAVFDGLGFLRWSIAALAIGVLTLPAPFLTLFGSSGESHPKPAWPIPTLSIDSELAKIRFQAEVSEVAQLRKLAAEQPNDDFDNLIWFGFAAVLVGVWAIGYRQYSKKERGS